MDLSGNLAAVGPFAMEWTSLLIRFTICLLSKRLLGNTHFRWCSHLVDFMIDTSLKSFCRKGSRRG